MTNSVVGQRRSSKELPKAKLAPKKKKGMVTVGWSAASPILNPSRTITSEKYAQQINEVHGNFNACNRHWSTERA